MLCSTPSFALVAWSCKLFFWIAVDYKIPLQILRVLVFILPFIDTKSMNYGWVWLPGVTTWCWPQNGYTPKGSSILCVRNEKHFKNQVQKLIGDGSIYTPTMRWKCCNNIVFTSGYVVMDLKYKENSEKIEILQRL